MKILIAVMLMVITSEGSAHSFNLGFVAPLSGPLAETGQQALDGFMLATTEQDAHLFEESDGHLGGLDSYVIKIDSSVDDKTTIDRIESLLRNKEPLFIAGVFSPGIADQIAGLRRKRLAPATGLGHGCQCQYHPRQGARCSQW